MKTMKTRTINELVFRVEVAVGGGPASVSVSNAETRDRNMVRALARILELWLNRGRTR